jgi:hypothetical protein
MKQSKVIFLVTAILVFSLVLGACRTTTPTANVTETKAYKIGILTGTVSQGEEEYNEAQNQKKTLGDMIVHSTYPDNFTTETETVISQALQMASDPAVKAIVWVQSIPGASAAIAKVKEVRPDIFFISGVPGEDPAVIAAKSEIVLQATRSWWKNARNSASSLLMLPPQTPRVTQVSLVPSNSSPTTSNARSKSMARIPLSSPQTAVCRSL